MNLQNKVTVVLVTSPIVSHPNTELIEKVVDSFKLVQDLPSCNLLIMADGVKIGNFKPKKGSVPEDMVLNYNLYLETLEQKIQESDQESMWSRTELIKLPHHVGFGHAVYHALKMCQTEYVLVVQHDHPFSCTFSLDPVINLLDSRKAVYVSLPISTVWRHVNRCSSLYQIDLRKKTIEMCDSKFVPILFWYDGTHLARRQSYIDLVFEGDIPSPVGQFIEDNFSGKVMALLREDYEKWSQIYPMFAYQPFEEELPLIFHLDGRKYKTDRERKQLGWIDNAGTVT